MNDIFVVCIDQRGAVFLDDAQRLVGRHTTIRVRLDMRLKIPAFQQLHGHINHVAVTIEIVYLDDVGVRQHLRAAGFALQGNKGVRVIFKILIQNFYGDIRVGIIRLHLA